MEDDLISVTKSITVKDLEWAYQNLIFPWPIEGEDLVPWFSPSMRGVLEFEKFHLSRSTLKQFRKMNFEVTFCKCFEKVINNCASVKRSEQEGTWINSIIIDAYVELFKKRKAYSVEVWLDDELVGGMYGVVSDKYLSGESMFHTVTGASKFALHSLVERLKSLGLSYIDTQMVTPAVEKLGGREITKREFSEKIKRGIVLDENFYKGLSL